MTSHYKFVFLIIDSDNEPCYEFNRKILRSCLNYLPDVRPLFVRARINQTDPICLEGDTLFWKGTESYIPGILEKTLAAMDYCLTHVSFDFLIRTNLSSFWNIRPLLALFPALPRSLYVSAIIGRYTEDKAVGTPYYNTPFPSGSGTIFSRDVIQQCVNNQTSFIRDLPDDVAIGQFLTTQSIPIQPGQRHDYIYNTHTVSESDVSTLVATTSHYHYRVKGYDRQYDNRIFEYLYNATHKPYPSTLVTFYFNLTTLPDATDAVRPQSFYMEKGRVTLKLKTPMVIFCDESTYPLLKAMRDEEVADQSLTQYIVKSLIDYDFYKDNYPIIRKNREGVACYVNDRNTSSYYITSMFKILGLQIAHERNYFKTPFYTWVDFGGSHVMRSFESGTLAILANPRPKVSLCYIHYRSHEELEYRMNNRIQGGYCGIAAGSITVEADYVSRFYQGCMSIFQEMLTKGIGHGEEQVLTFFYDRFPELCTIYYGDYYSILTNYHAPIQDYPSIRHFFINESSNKGRRDLARTCAQEVLKAVEAGQLSLDQGEIASLRSV